MGGGRALAANVDDFEADRLGRFWVEWSLSFFVAPAPLPVAPAEAGVQGCVVKGNKVNRVPTALLDPRFRGGDGKSGSLQP